MRQAVRTRGSLILALGVVTALGVIPLTAEPVRAAVFPVIVVPKPKPKPKPPTIHRPPHNNSGNNGFNGGTPPGGGGGPPPGGQKCARAGHAADGPDRHQPAGPLRRPAQDAACRLPPDVPSRTTARESEQGRPAQWAGRPCRLAALVEPRCAETRERVSAQRG